MSDEEEVFSSAIEIESPCERARFVASACAGDSRLQREVEALLSAHELPGNILDQEAGEQLGVCVPPEGVLELVDGFEITRELGRGGMGVVYEAVQTHPVRRRVALKLVKPGMDTDEVLARFEAERQALALMDHPHIAKVLEAGATATSRPYFVMEMVEGASITRFCDEHQLPLRQRLELFHLVCLAVQHAHQKGVIHRDLKPNNILVVEQDGHPVPKIIDFGVAKATLEQLTRETLVTRMGQLVGTPEYMSPEQADWNSGGVDTRTDVYALGVVLYELLTGACPFDRETLQTKAIDELLRFIREKTPPRPSTRLSTVESLTTNAAARKVEPRRLFGQLRGELDWIAMKALEKDRGRRYDSAASFAADVQRYLDDDQVLARPPSTGYLLRKFARRNKAAVAAVLAFAFFATTTAWLVGRTEAVAEQRDVQSRIAHANRLANLSVSFRELWPIRSILLAIEAVETSFRRQEPVLAAAHEALLNAVADVGGRPLPISNVHSIALSESTIATLTVSGSIYRWELKSDDGALVANPLASIGEVQSNTELRCNQQWLVVRGDRFRRWDCFAENVAATELRLTDLSDDVASFAVSDDGRWLFTRGNDGLVTLWDLSVKSPELSAKILGRSNSGLSTGRAATVENEWVVLDAGVDPYRRWAVTMDQRTINLWDLSAAGPDSAAIEVDVSEQIYGIEFSRSGDYLAVGTGGAPVRKIWLFELASEDVVSSPRVWESNKLFGGKAIAFAPGSRVLVTGAQNLCQWDLVSDDVSPSGEVVAHQQEYDGIFDLCVSCDEQRLLTAGGNGRIAIWRLTPKGIEGEPEELRGAESTVQQLSLSSYDRWLAALSQDGTVRVWDLDNAKVQNSAYALQVDGSVDLPAFDVSQSGRVVATAMSEGRVRVWELSGEGVRWSHDFHPHHGETAQLRISRDEQWLATAGDDSEARLWNLGDRDFEHSLLLTKFSSTVRPIAFSPDDRWLAMADVLGNVRLFDLQADDIAASVQPLVGHAECVNQIVFNADGRWMATTSMDGTSRLWDLHSEQPNVGSVALRGHRGTVWSASFFHDGRRLATAGSDKTVKIWNLKQIDPSANPQTLEAGSGALHVLASPDDRWLAITRFDLPPLLWDLESSDATSTPVSLGGSPDALYCGISPDGRWLATGGSRGIVQLWDLHASDPTQDPITLHAHQGKLWWLLFSEDSRRLFTRSTDEKVRVWELNLPTLLEKAKHLAGRSPTREELLGK